MSNSPENKCPDECPECGSEKRWPPPVWTDGESGVTEECWHPWHEKPRCPDCGGSGANEFGDAFNNPCQTCGGSGRINTSGDFIGDKPGQGEHSCHENCPCSPSPDRETGREEEWRCTGWDGQEPTYERIEKCLRCDGRKWFLKYDRRTESDIRVPCPDCVTSSPDVRELLQRLVRVYDDEDFQSKLDPESSELPYIVDEAEEWLKIEASASPSAAPTNQGVNQTEGEGELRARIEELERRATEFSAWLSFVAGQGKAAEIKEAFRSDTGFGPYILSDEEFMRREEVARAAVPKEEA